MAIAVVKALEPFNLFFLEEPLRSEVIGDSFAEY